MIISFTARNYKSIKDEQTLNLSVENFDDVHQENIAYPDGEKKIPILRSAAIWGPNASGKSNLLEAIGALRDFTATSHQYGLDQPIDEYLPFKLDPANCNLPVSFELQFIGRDKLRYIYSIEFTRKTVVSESLYFYPGAKPAKLFDRKADLEQSNWFGTKLAGAKAMSCLENQGYLSVAAHHRDSSKQIKDVFRYIRNDINMVGHRSNLFLAKLLQDDVFRKSLTALLACADTGIREVEVKEEDFDPSRLPENMPEKLKQQILRDFRLQPVFKHNDSSEGFSQQEESDGTRRLYALAPMIILGLSSSDVWILDEFDCQLHPRLAEVIIRLFHDGAVNGKNPQLIFTSHNTALMSSDLFRRDQIWFTQKDEKGATELTCLDEYNQVRADTNFEKWYRDGRFDAVPELRYGELKKAILAVVGHISTEAENE